MMQNRAGPTVSLDLPSLRFNDDLNVNNKRLDLEEVVEP
jgi:hypothetical protein